MYNGIEVAIDSAIRTVEQDLCSKVTNPSVYNSIMNALYSRKPAMIQEAGMNPVPNNVAAIVYHHYNTILQQYSQAQAAQQTGGGFRPGHNVIAQPQQQTAMPGFNGGPAMVQPNPFMQQPQGQYVPQQQTNPFMQQQQIQSNPFQPVQQEVQPQTIDVDSLAMFKPIHKTEKHTKTETPSESSDKEVSAKPNVVTPTMRVEETNHREETHSTNTDGMLSDLVDESIFDELETDPIKVEMVTVKAPPKRRRSSGLPVAANYTVADVIEFLMAAVENATEFTYVGLSEARDRDGKYKAIFNSLSELPKGESVLDDTVEDLISKLSIIENYSIKDLRRNAQPLMEAIAKVSSLLDINTVVGTQSTDRLQAVLEYLREIDNAGMKLGDIVLTDDSARIDTISLISVIALIHVTGSSSYQEDVIDSKIREVVNSYRNSETKDEYSLDTLVSMFHTGKLVSEGVIEGFKSKVKCVNCYEYVMKRIRGSFIRIPKSDW